MLVKGLNTYNDQYKLIKHKIDKNNKVVYEKNGKLFRAKDVVDHNQIDKNLNGNTYVAENRLTIQTPYLFNFEKDDRIYSIRTKKMWLIDSVTTKDDNQMKEKSSRPTTDYVLSLVGGVDA